jgi:hypothetical protein
MRRIERGHVAVSEPDEAMTQNVWSWVKPRDGACGVDAEGCSPYEAIGPRSRGIEVECGEFPSGARRNPCMTLFASK